MGAMASQITSLTIIYSTIHSGADQRKHQSSASLAFVRVNSPHKWPVTRKIFPSEDVIMTYSLSEIYRISQDFEHTVWDLLCFIVLRHWSFGVISLTLTVWFHQCEWSTPKKMGISVRCIHKYYFHRSFCMDATQSAILNISKHTRAICAPQDYIRIWSGYKTMSIY